jgi:hypothetical protein
MIIKAKWMKSKKHLMSSKIHVYKYHLIKTRIRTQKFRICKMININRMQVNQKVKLGQMSPIPRLLMTMDRRKILIHAQSSYKVKIFRLKIWNLLLKAFRIKEIKIRIWWLVKSLNWIEIRLIMRIKIWIN